MRILILVAIASQTAAFIFSIFGLNCTSIGLQRPDLKYRLVRQNSSKNKTSYIEFRTLFPLFFIWFRLYQFQLAPSCSRSHWWKILINLTNIRYHIFYPKVDDTKFESVLVNSKESNNFIVTLIIVNRVFIYMSRWAVIFEFWYRPLLKFVVGNFPSM